MSDAVSWVGVGVSGAALSVSIIALWKSSRAQRKAHAAQQRIVEIEEQREKDRLAVVKRAELRAELRKTETYATRLYIVNGGPAEARNVNVVLDGQSLSEHPAGTHGNELGSVIGPESETSCILRTSSLWAPPFQIQITWEDDSEQLRAYRSTLTL